MAKVTQTTTSKAKVQPPTSERPPPVKYEYTIFAGKPTDIIRDLNEGPFEWAPVNLQVENGTMFVIVRREK